MDILTDKQEAERRIAEYNRIWDRSQRIHWCGFVGTIVALFLMYVGWDDMGGPAYKTGSIIAWAPIPFYLKAAYLRHRAQRMIEKGY